MAQMSHVFVLIAVAAAASALDGAGGREEIKTTIESSVQRVSSPTHSAETVTTPQNLSSLDSRQEPRFSRGLTQNKSLESLATTPTFLLQHLIRTDKIQSTATTVQPILFSTTPSATQRQQLLQSKLPSASSILLSTAMMPAHHHSVFPSLSFNAADDGPAAVKENSISLENDLDLLDHNGTAVSTVNEIEEAATVTDKAGHELLNSTIYDRMGIGSTVAFEKLLFNISKDLADSRKPTSLKETLIQLPGSGNTAKNDQTEVRYVDVNKGFQGEYQQVPADIYNSKIIDNHLINILNSKAVSSNKRVHSKRSNVNKNTIEKSKENTSDLVTANSSSLAECYPNKHTVIRSNVSQNVALKAISNNGGGNFTNIHRNDRKTSITENAVQRKLSLEQGESIKNPLPINKSLEFNARKRITFPILKTILKDSKGNKETDTINKNVRTKNLPKEVALLEVDQNSSKLVGYSEDPFHVSETLKGVSRNVEVLHDVSAGLRYPGGIRQSIFKPMLNRIDTLGLVHTAGRYIDQNIHANVSSFPKDPSNASREEIENLNNDTTTLLPHGKQKNNVSRINKLVEGEPMIHSRTNINGSSLRLSDRPAARPVAEFRGIESDAPNTKLQDHSINFNISVNKYEIPRVPENDSFDYHGIPDFLPIDQVPTSTEIVHHEGLSYIRKNFLIMPVFNQSIFEHQDILTSDRNQKQTYPIYPELTTEMSLLNKRVPIYQEIAGTMHIDSSIDDTLDTSEPISPTAEDDVDEKYLPLANSSVVNLVDPSVNTKKNITVKSFKERHYSFVLKQKEELMTSLMDQGANPCEDFYQYACGGWQSRFTLRPDQAVDNTFERLRDDLDSVLASLLEREVSPDEAAPVTAAKTLYRGCMNLKAIEVAGTRPLLDLLQELGGWPVLEGAAWGAGGQQLDVALQMARLRLLNNEVLLGETVADDVTNSSLRIVKLDQPELGLPGPNYYLSAGDVVYRDAYLSLMVRASRLLGADPITAMRDMADVLFFETQLAKILVPVEERRNLTALHRLFTRQQLREDFPGFSWDLYLDTVAPRHSNYTQQVRVFCQRYIKRLLPLLEETPNRTINNYLLWRLVKNRLGNLGSPALSIKQDYIRVLFGRVTQPNRWRSCISYVNGNLGGVVGAMFVRQYFPGESRADTEEMIGLIRQAFGDSVSNAEWMMPETRQTAVDKVQAIVWNVGYPEELLNDTYMMELYGKLDFSPTTHFANVVRVLRMHATRAHALLDHPHAPHKWSAAPATVNAYYSRTKNMIMFPAGILQPPFYHPAYPRALNFGGVGVVIGHEISHGFDDGGRQFDKRGTLQQWWSKKDVMAFYARATCMLEQYSRFEVPELGLPVNAITTLGENIADNAGLNIAHTAYQKWAAHHSDTPLLHSLNLTLPQLFFLNFGQIWCEVNTPEAALTNLRSGTHSPNRYRVVGTLSNSKAFSEAFQCPEGSPMNPKDKCEVW